MLLALLGEPLAALLGNKCSERAPTVEGARWSVDGWPRHRDHSNSNILVIPLIETAEGVKCIEEIAVIDGIDYFLLGFADLSQDMGIDRQTHADVLAQEWTRVRDAVHAAGGRIGRGRR